MPVAGLREKGDVEARGRPLFAQPQHGLVPDHSVALRSDAQHGRRATGSLPKQRGHPFRGEMPALIRTELISELGDEVAPPSRYGEIWRDSGRFGEIRGDTGRCGEIWGEI